ncbi:unnamed protein product [Strongylus vulgaris]|uniref:Uncharacterized protein n=1 Tax=Strongylus vulgaris TaxID=40348 RepID=A0A3P7LGD8_STRVU|nr:unnamed protein product [Strongylus vulgaris]
MNVCQMSFLRITGKRGFFATTTGGGISKMDLNVDAKENEPDPKRKQFTLCSECHQIAVEKRINRLGVLCCLGAWWLCGLGVLFCL